MAWNFRKRIKIIPGINLNISKKGISTTIGIKGTSINIGPNGAFLNTSIPGTGIYNRQRISRSNSSTKKLQNTHNPIIPIPSHKFINETYLKDNIFSVDANEVTSQNMQGIKDTILLAHQQRSELLIDRLMVINQWKKNERRLNISYFLLYGFLLKNKTLELKADILEQKNTLIQIDNQLKQNVVELDYEFDEDMQSLYTNMYESFRKLCHMEKVWDITSSYANDQFTTRSSAAYNIVRRQVRFSITYLSEIKSKTSNMMWQNANGADLYFYPNFMIVWNNKQHFAIVAYNELDISYNTTRFIEDEFVPKDAVIIDQTWKKVNKNGQPDRRFKDNYKIPIVAYGCITLKTDTGLNERYLFSNDKDTAAFFQDFLKYKNSIIKLDYFPDATIS